MKMPTRSELISVANYYFKRINKPKIISTTLEEVRQIYIEHNINYDIVSAEFENKLIENIKLTADEEDLAKIEAEEKENIKQKRYERLFRIKKNGCNEFMLTLSQHERNIQNIKVKQYLDRPSKIKLLPKIKNT